MGLFGDSPNPAKEAEKAILLDLELLPMRRQIEAAATRGGKVTVGGVEYDFTGLGEADVQAKIAEATAKTLLDLQKEFGAEFIALRLDELQRSDPEGFAMRRNLYERIKSDLASAQSGEGLESSRRLQDSILAELDAGGDLSAAEARSVEQTVLGGQVSRGNYLGNAAATQEAGAMIGASQARRAQRQQEALAFLTSGISPDAVQTRESQQAMQNLGSFIAGETPQAQFGQVSGAQIGAAPFFQTGSLPGINQNAGQGGVQFALATQGQNTNPWLAGIAGGLQGANIWASLGGGFGGGANNGIAWAPNAPANAGPVGPN